MKKYKPPRTPKSQIHEYAAVYLRHGAKANRRKQINRLISASEAAIARYRLNDIRQIGRKHVHWWDEQLCNAGKSLKTRMAYWYGWKLLWQMLGRTGSPPKPREMKK